jgi:multidrug efflux pump subunit AcrA (membrane-fusion protein)
VNCDITTQTEPDALILPQYAVLQNDQGAFVKTLQGNTVIQVPVTLGIQDNQGNVEIVSGATEGEKVINLGLK